MVNIKLELKFDRLISEYALLRDKMLDLNDDYFDAMGYDLQGYSECVHEVIEDDEEFKAMIDDLEHQVKAFRLIVRGLENINYIYC